MKKIILIFVGIVLTVKGFSNVFISSEIKTNLVNDQNRMLNTNMNDSQRSIFSLKEGKVYTRARYCSVGTKLMGLELEYLGFGPYTSLGLRIQNNHIGHDFSLNETFTHYKYNNFSNNFGFNYSLLFYPIPNIDKEVYFGPTIGLSLFSFNWHGNVTLPIINLGGVIGAQYRVKDKLHFIQIKTEAQGFSPDEYLLSAGFSYGISF